MEQLVQSALDALERGDKNKAMDLLKQVFDSDPNNIDALLLLATLVDEPTRKRQVLNRVLSMEATNKVARDMMLEMDRAEMGSYRSRTAGATAPGAQADSTASLGNHSSAGTSPLPLTKPLTFRYSPTWMIVLYIFTTFSCCATFWFASMDVRNSMPFLAMAIVLGLTALTVSSRVELSETTIRVSTLLGSTEMEWGEIASIKLNPLKRNLELTSTIGEVANVSIQTTGYKSIVRVLSQKRPDLTDSLFQLKQPVIPETVSKPSSAVSYNETFPAPTLKPAEPVSSIPAAAVVVPVAQTSTPSQTSSIKAPSTSQTAATPGPKTEQTLVFQFPLFWRIFMYAFPIFFGCLGLGVAYQNVLYGLPFLALAAVLVVIALAFSPKVEITESGIRATRMLESSEVKWNEIVQMKSNAMSRRLELSKEGGEIVKVSTQVSGYPRLVEIIRQRRPDLFSLTSQSGSAGKPTATRDGAFSVPVFTGTKTFTKNSFAQYGVILLMVPLFAFGIWTLVAMNDKFVGVGVILVALFFTVMSLFNVNELKVEPNKLTTESFFAQKEYTASQIAEVGMKTVRSRHGIATNFVNVKLVDGGSLRLLGFPDGDEVLYGILQEWWETYRNK